jgi:hypothetical protein
MSTGQTFKVDLPAGGPMYLQSAEEVELWQGSQKRYVEDYHLTKMNDLVLLGVLLQQQIIVFRSQRKLNGMEPELDANNVPTGRYIAVTVEDDDYQSALNQLNKASAEIRNIEKSLGIDKVTREAGGAMSVSNYLRTLKSAVHDRGIHLSKRVIAFEAFAQELRTKLRMLANLDAEDRAYHNITPEALLQWSEEELKRLEQVDKDHAREWGKLYAGKL